MSPITTPTPTSPLADHHGTKVKIIESKYLDLLGREGVVAAAPDGRVRSVWVEVPGMPTKVLLPESALEVVAPRSAFEPGDRVRIVGYDVDGVRGDVDGELGVVMKTTGRYWRVKLDRPERINYSTSVPGQLLLRPDEMEHAPGAPPVEPVPIERAASAYREGDTIRVLSFTPGGQGRDTIGKEGTVGPVGLTFIKASVPGCGSFFYTADEVELVAQAGDRVRVRGYDTKSSAEANGAEGVVESYGSGTFWRVVFDAPVSDASGWTTDSLLVLPIELEVVTRAADLAPVTGADLVALDDLSGVQADIMDKVVEDFTVKPGLWLANVEYAADDVRVQVVEVIEVQDEEEADGWPPVVAVQEDGHEGLFELEAMIRPVTLPEVTQRRVAEFTVDKAIKAVQDYFDATKDGS